MRLHPNLPRAGEHMYGDLLGGVDTGSDSVDLMWKKDVIARWN